MADATVSNARPWAIFTSYMLLAATLTLKSLAIIRHQHDKSHNGPFNPSRRRAIRIFISLAAMSLATTWYHMFRFFQWSYTQWWVRNVFSGHSVTDSSANGLRLGAWLRDTSLFRQAWASTLESGPRAWWSLQIFGFCANWSVMLALYARKRRIPSAWVFMLLGQVVAISFAANLSFLAILCSAVPATPEKSDNPAKATALSWHTIILITTTIWATSIPSAMGKPGFMSLLLGPHLLAFAPLLLNPIFPPRMLGEPAWIWKVASMAWVLAVACRGVIDGGQGLDAVLKTLYEHPAVSSVGWDVICCWISFGAWAMVGVE